MTQLLFQDAFLNCCVSKVEKYCLENNIAFKIVLVVDTAPGHPPFIGDVHVNVKVLFLPPNTTSWIRPVGQGVVAALKAHDLRRTFAQDIDATEEGLQPLPASGTSVGLGGMSASSAGVASGRRHSRGSSMT